MLPSQLSQNSASRVNLYLEAMYGGLVPQEAQLKLSLAHELRRDGVLVQAWQVHAVQTGLSWIIDVSWPSAAADDGGQILLSPDACWMHCVNPDAVQAVHSHDVAFASFNRLLMAQDPPAGQRQGALFERWPQLHFGALAAWAWGISHSVRALHIVFPKAQVGVVGHSRGGKAALLAAATDPRIAAVISHNSGTGGASSLQQMSPGAESLQDLVQAFPHWLGPQAKLEATQKELVDGDGTQLWAQIAPRGLLIMQAMDDLWANPAGARHRSGQLAPDWQNRSEALARVERWGGHAMTAQDWSVAADFVRRIGPGSATIRP